MPTRDKTTLRVTEPRFVIPVPSSLPHDRRSRANVIPAHAGILDRLASDKVRLDAFPSRLAPPVGTARLSPAYDPAEGRKQ